MAVAFIVTSDKSAQESNHEVSLNVDEAELGN
jgi:hypothetical protein